MPLQSWYICSKNKELCLLNFQQIYARVKEIAEGADESKRILEERRNQARELLVLYAADLDYLRQKVEAAKAVDANIRCAAPLKESLASFHPPPVPVTEATVIAADGSQVNPDRHAAIQFCIINVGVIAMKTQLWGSPLCYRRNRIALWGRSYAERQPPL